MKIGQYTFDEFKKIAEDFHGCAAPGLMLGAYMVECGKSRLSENTLFEVICETQKCLPDAVQLLTLCSTGNCRLSITSHGRYALSLYDKYTLEGFRVSLDAEAMKAYPELFAWFLKAKPKPEQNTEQILQDIETAGDSICIARPVKIDEKSLTKNKMGALSICPQCRECYPVKQGGLCLACQQVDSYWKI